MSQTSEHIDGWQLAEGDPGSFSRLGAIAVGPDDRVLVADSGGPTLPYFESDGSMLGALDIANAIDVAVNHLGTVAVSSHRQVAVFGPGPLARLAYA